MTDLTDFIRNVHEPLEKAYAAVKRHRDLLRAEIEQAERVGFNRGLRVQENALARAEAAEARVAALTEALRSHFQLDDKGRPAKWMYHDDFERIVAAADRPEPFGFGKCGNGDDEECPCDPQANEDGTATCSVCGWTGEFSAVTYDDVIGALRDFWEQADREQAAADRPEGTCSWCDLHGSCDPPNCPKRADRPGRDDATGGNA